MLRYGSCSGVEDCRISSTRKLSRDRALVEDVVVSSLGEAPSPQYLKEQLESLEQQQADLVDAVATVGGKKAMQDILLVKLEAITTELEAVRKTWEEQRSQRMEREGSEFVGVHGGEVNLFHLR